MTANHKFSAMELAEAQIEDTLRAYVTKEHERLVRDGWFNARCDKIIKANSLRLYGMNGTDSGLASFRYMASRHQFKRQAAEALKRGRRLAGDARECGENYALKATEYLNKAARLRRLAA